MAGKLYIVGTPIGNLEDLSMRALRVLREVDLIACEDTRHTARLLSHYGIETPRQSYHEHNEQSRAARLIALLLEGKNIALVSDAGTPLVSDPGYAIVSACDEQRIDVVAVPGPSAAVAALAGSGLPTDAFLFAGFLPPRTSRRRNRLQELATVPATLVFFEAPHRVLDSLSDMNAVLGPRRACVARELTKVHEEWIRGTLPAIREILAARPEVRGEFTIVVDRGEPAPPDAAYPESLSEHLEQEISRSGRARNDALKEVARQRGITRKDAYRLLIEEKDSSSAGLKE
jgi:16S rRNA (cytidine1402-2'-O)-methyltransferase